VLNGARVIMVNRKEEQGKEAINKIKLEAGEDAQVEWVGCDMGKLKQIKEVFTKIREQEKRLDLVCLYSPSLTVSSYLGSSYLLFAEV
jgi:NAD(P)-dependent dehydrogenase (short-subunit alcohol dehydrogenase family)